MRLKLSCNEVHFTNSFILLVTNMLCSEFHCHKDLNLIPFSYKIRIFVVDAIFFVYCKVYSVIYDSGAVPE
jgi:hypothetical protein